MKESWLFLVLYLILAPALGGLLNGADRKISARLQGRQGPPLLQPFYDLSKLFAKEPVSVNRVQTFLICGFLFFIVFTGCLFFWGGDLLLVFFALTLAEIFYMMAAFSANSPFSSMGAERELMQAMSYEPMVLLSAIGFYVATGSFSVREIVSGGRSAIAFLPGIFAGFVFILTIKLRKHPFDLSTSHHAHQEMVKGMTTEISGSSLGLVEIAHWYETIFLLGVVALFILNADPRSILVAVLVCILTYLLEILIDNTCSRVKWQTMLKTTWMVTLVAGVINLMIITMIK